MALPRLNETPEYEMTIPSMGRKVPFRPFLVKEQKVLLMAFESKDRNQILKAMLKTIDACTETDVVIEKLPTFDIDYMFTQIRCKSVGESTDVVVKCKNDSCKHDNRVKIDLNDVQPPSGINNDVVVDLTKDISVELKYPDYTTIFENMDDTNETQTMMNFIVNCVSSVHVGEERISMKDEPLTERMAFLESLNASQFQLLTEFINNIPQLNMTVSFTCEKCGESNNNELKGLEDFFL